MSKRNRFINRLARKGPETEPTPNLHIEAEEVSRKLAAEGYRVWSQHPEGEAALTRVTDEPKPWSDWETKHKAPTRGFKDVDGTTKRLNVAVALNHFISNNPEIRSVNVVLEQLDPRSKSFRPLVAVHDSGQEAGVALGEYGEKLHPGLDTSGASELLARGLDRAEIELYKRRPSAQ